MEQDIIVLGCGPAGLSAAVAARSRNKRVLVIGNPVEESPLARAERVDNYLGLPGLTGLELLQTMKKHAETMGAQMLAGRVNAIMAWNGSFALTVGSDVYQGRALILAPGVVHATKYPGEEKLLGRGVSYCATCDGMLYRGRRVMVVGRTKDAPEEANFLQSIGCRVAYVSKERPEHLKMEVDHLSGTKLEVLGEDRVTGLRLDGEEHPCDGVFILRQAVAPGDLLPGLAVEDGSITVNRAMETNLEGVFAAGDCTGKPWQVSKAVGEGLIAGECAAEYLDNLQKNT
ncbi:MAG: NAD(P)/FAD-dependent oxidoreductase [Ruminococcaceae bacterium]|nr:NAD(P)/FAD-dependent oxidoreductase [Oscillospiraceae bacterium]